MIIGLYVLFTNFNWNDLWRLGIYLFGNHPRWFPLPADHITQTLSIPCGRQTWALEHLSGCCKYLRVFSGRINSKNNNENLELINYWQLFLKLLKKVILASKYNSILVFWGYQECKCYLQDDCSRPTRLKMMKNEVQCDSQRYLIMDEIYLTPLRLVARGKRNFLIICLFIDELSIKLLP